MTELIHAQVGLRCEALGLAPPPATARVEVSRHQGVWRLSLDPAEDLAPLIGWVNTVDPSQIVVGRDRRVVAYIQHPNPAITLLANAGIRDALLQPSGEVLIQVEGPREDLQGIMARLEGIAGGADLQRVRPRAATPQLLTRAQHAAIVTAVEAGYYKIPRSLNLNELSRAVGISPASLSERLRRAEARLVADYVSRIP